MIHTINEYNAAHFKTAFKLFMDEGVKVTVIIGSKVGGKGTLTVNSSDLAVWVEGEPDAEKTAENVIKALEGALNEAKKSLSMFRDKKEDNK